MCLFNKIKNQFLNNNIFEIYIIIGVIFLTGLIMSKDIWFTINSVSGVIIMFAFSKIHFKSDNVYKFIIFIYK